MRTFEGICQMVAHNVGVGIVPEHAARRSRRTMAIRSIRLSDRWATRRLSLCVRDIEALPPLARGLLIHLGAP
jgi:DNA-binding transcriptional LysR family regulator